MTEAPVQVSGSDPAVPSEEPPPGVALPETDGGLGILNK
jgi:hypothetical protein